MAFCLVYKVKEFLVDVWNSRKLSDNIIWPGPQPNSWGWDLGQDGKWWNGGMAGVVYKLSHSSDVVGACIC